MGMLFLAVMRDTVSFMAVFESHSVFKRCRGTVHVKPEFVLSRLAESFGVSFAFEFSVTLPNTPTVGGSYMAGF